MNKKQAIGLILVLLFTGIILSPVIVAFDTFGGYFWDVVYNKDHYWVSHGWGQSMLPVIDNGDLLVIQLATHPDFEIKKGDIVVYVPPDDTVLGYKLQSMNVVVCHRIIANASINGETKYLIQGDNCNERDPWVIDADDIIGVVKIIVSKDDVFRQAIVERIAS